MEKLQVIFLLGWIFHLLTWIIPYSTKDDIKQKVILMTLNGISLGLFIAYGIIRWC